MEKEKVILLQCQLKGYLDTDIVCLYLTSSNMLLLAVIFSSYRENVNVMLEKNLNFKWKKRYQ